MQQIKNYLKSSPIVQRVWHKYKGSMISLKPMNARASTSDLFIWRCDALWETSFNVVNISSFIFPEDKPSEQCTVVCYDCNGNLVVTHDFEIPPFAMHNLDFNEILKDKANGAGTFCVFHYSTCIDEFKKHNAHLTERGYVAYKHKSNILQSFCHGNLVAVSKTKNSAKIGFTTTESQQLYAPQTLFSDCKKFDLVYTNPSKKANQVKLTFYNKKNEVQDFVEVLIPPCGMKVIEMDNSSGDIHLIKSYSNISMLRPIAFKYHDCHFDVFHT